MITISICPFCKTTEGDKDDDEEPYLVVEQERNQFIGGYHMRCRKCWATGPRAPTEHEAKELWDKARSIRPR